jgi:glycine amidinotransferase
MKSLNSYDEWSPLKEIIVGSPINYKTQDLELSFKLFFHDVAYSSFWYPDYKKRIHDNISNDNKGSHTSRLKRRYLEELTEDVAEFVTTLENLGVRVHRPTVMSDVDTVKTPYWESTTVPALNIRDRAIIIGDQIIETAPQVRARYFENDLLKPIFYKYFLEGARWVTMPNPIMTDFSFDVSYVSNQNVPCFEDIYVQKKSNNDIGYEIMIDGAQCVRFGTDILINVSNQNHELGYRWLQQHLGNKFRLHKIYRMTDNHIDSIILPLKPGKLLLRNPQFLNMLPKPLQKWDIIYPPEPSKNIFPQYEDDELIITSNYIDLNVLSIDQDRVIVN